MTSYNLFTLIKKPCSSAIECIRTSITLSYTSHSYHAVVGYSLSDSSIPTSPPTFIPANFLLLRFSLINRHLLPCTAILTLVDNLLPAQRLLRVLEELDSGEVVLVLLHGRDPGDVVKRHDLETEVFVVADLLDFAEEGGQVGCWDVVDVGEEVCWCKL